jgi:hypothetical protein
MESMMWQKIIGLIIGLVILFAIGYVLFFGPGKTILINLGLISGLTKEAEELGESNFDVIVRNLSTCQLSKETNCACEIFPSWPGTFPEDSILTIKAIGKDTLLEWGYNKKVYKNQTIKNLLISAKKIEKGQEFSKVPFTEIKTLNWKTEPPVFEQNDLRKVFEKKYHVISPYVYKEGDVLYFFIFNGQTSKIKEIENKITEIKKCKA